jgi:hypothetical protein
MADTLGEEFFQSQIHRTLSILNILSASLAIDNPMPPYLKVPPGASPRDIILQRRPKQLSLERVEESGFAVFAALAVTYSVGYREVGRCVDLVKKLIGEVAVYGTDPRREKKES